MTKIDKLRHRALETCERHGHTMAPFTHHMASSTRDIAFSNCTRCLMEVSLDTNPPANGIDICGEAVALNCEVKP